MNVKVAGACGAGTQGLGQVGDQRCGDGSEALMLLVEGTVILLEELEDGGIIGGENATKLAALKSSVCILEGSRLGDGADEVRIHWMRGAQALGHAGSNLGGNGAQGPAGEVALGESLVLDGKLGVLLIPLKVAKDSVAAAREYFEEGVIIGRKVRIGVTDGEVSVGLKVRGGEVRWVSFLDGGGLGGV